MIIFAFSILLATGAILVLLGILEVMRLINFTPKESLVEMYGLQPKHRASKEILKVIRSGYTNK